MKRWIRTSPVVLTVLLLCAGCAGREEPSDHAAGEHSSGEAPSATQPYAGLENRSIKALSEEQVEDLLAGRGAGYALAAELNHYPGPAHVLELGDDLKLSAEQEQTVHDIYLAMQNEAKALGRELVDLEAQLDESFRDEDIGEEKLARITSEIANAEGRLRKTHLAAHLKTKDILAPEQIDAYDRLRGYTEAGDTEPYKEGQHESGNHNDHSPEQRK